MWTALGLFLFLFPFLTVCGLVGYVYWYVRKHFLGQLERIFVEKPLFIIPRGEADPLAEDVRFPGVNNMVLQGVYFKAHKSPRKGVILFGIEFGADRWSCRSYCDPLLDAGYDVFAYEPRSQGKSDPVIGYEPLQWITNYEVEDARAAFDYLKSRPDADPKGFGLFGISKGANAGLAAMGYEPAVRCAVTDGAFGLLSVMVPYMRHWVAIYSPRYLVHGLLPAWFYAHIAMFGIRRVEHERKVRFCHLERVVGKIRRPVLMIHGEADSYIKMEMARAILRRINGQKELWLVPKARHNQSITVAGAEYARRVVTFFDENL
jgi:uncharacterized protein